MARATITLIAVLFFLPPQSHAQWRSVGSVDTGFVRGPAAEFHSGSAAVRISFLTEEIVRVRAVPRGAFPSSRSVAVLPKDRPAVQMVAAEDDSLVRLSSARTTVNVRKHPLRISVHAADGTILNQDAARGMAWDGAEVRVWKQRISNEHFYGLGEKSGILNRTSKSYSLWNSDIPAYRADTDPLYQSVPFIMTIRDGRAQGIFFDNSYRSSFDFGVESDARYAFGANGGEIDYYVFAGPTPADVLRQYTDLVGRMPLPPRWALGYQQSRWSYTPDAKVRQIARTFRQKRIPCDVIYLDIDYMEGYRVFTWNEQNFPRPAELLADLARDGFKVVPIIDPGIKVDTAYRAYRTGMQEDVFLKYPSGDIFLGNVWPGTCAFPDFSKPSTRAWWSRSIAELRETGVRGFWTDMNEPSVFDVPTKTIDLSVIHDDGGERTTHAKNHNVYGMQMTEATYAAAREARPNERPFILTRASFAGGHRFAAAWTGDNVSSWEHLQLAVPMCLGMSISGQPFVGSDIGGFIGAPDGELYARWLQFSVFTPLMRTHTVIGSPDQEPWSFGARFESINRATIELRYRLLPYLYNAMRQASETGIPVMRPLIFSYPSDSGAVWNDTEFLFGDDLLVAPVLWLGERERDVHLPKGIWYDFWTNERYEGGRDVRVTAPLERIPVFVREGAIIPTQQILQYVDQAGVNPLTLTVYPAANSSSEYYGDDGISFDYERGGYLLRSLSQLRESGELRFTLGRANGALPVPNRFVDIRLIGVERAPGMVSLGERKLLRMRALPAGEGWHHSSATRVLHVRVKESGDELSIHAVGTAPTPKSPGPRP